MAIHFPLHPNALGNNRAYLYLMDSYNSDHHHEWGLSELQEKFGRYFVEELIEEGVVCKVGNDRLRLTFKILGSIPNLVHRLISIEVCPFGEVLDRLPRGAKCNPTKLKAIVTFLANFELIQYYTDPCSSVTYLALDKDHRTEQEINEVYAVSEHLESRFRYVPDPEDTAAEFRLLIE